MKKIIIILSVVLIVLATGFYFWQKRDVYFFKGEIETEENGNINYDDIDDEEEGEDFDSGEYGDEENLDNNNEEDITLIEEFEDDCRTECRNVLDEEDHDYCLEICGLREGSNSEGGDCEKLEGFNKDVCFKNQAIQELDYSYCERIEDDNVLKESCKNRVLEEIIEKEQKSLLEE